MDTAGGGRTKINVFWVKTVRIGYQRLIACRTSFVVLSFFAFFLPLVMVSDCLSVSVSSCALFGCSLTGVWWTESLDSWLPWRTEGRKEDKLESIMTLAYDGLRKMNRDGRRYVCKCHAQTGSFFTVSIALTFACRLFGKWHIRLSSVTAIIIFINLFF